MNKKAAIYHFTDVSEKRPVVPQKVIKKLEEFTIALGYTEYKIFFDRSLVISEHFEFQKFLGCADQFDALIVQDFAHISRNIGRCISIMQELRKKNVTIYTPNNGVFTWDMVPFDEPLRVATYCCSYGTDEKMQSVIPLQKDLLVLFAKKKTNWTVIDQYHDITRLQINGEQPNLMRLLENKNKYDLLLVLNMVDVHRRTATFCRIREQHQLDIFALREGFLKYRKEAVP